MVPRKIVPETTWIDVASENEITKTLQCLNLNAVKNFCKQKPGTAGNTDSDKMIEKLNKLADMPESFSFSFQSHNSFMTEERLQQQIKAGDLEEKDVEEVELEDKEHAGVITGANGLTKPRSIVAMCVGLKAITQYTFVW